MEIQKKNKKITMELHPSEAELILRIREKYRFGEITVICRDGLPDKIGRTTIYEKVSWLIF